MESLVPKLQVNSISFDAEWPDRMAINLPHGLDIVIVKTPEGYVVDAYHADGQCLSTMSVWDDQIEDQED